MVLITSALDKGQPMQTVEHVDIEQYLFLRGKVVSEFLDQLIPEKEVSYNHLFQAARYSLFSGGKRIRPILALAVCECLQGSIEKALKPACTLEMVHTYSMIHDDLPCVDNDDYRRGNLTLHKVFPESHALLAGDFLLTHAFTVLAADPSLTPQQKVELIDILSTKIGGDGMIAGQIMDIEAEKKEIDIDQLSQIHYYKTGALIEASILFGAIIADVSHEEKEHLAKFGKKIGLAFQIVDDILDVTSTEKHGKGISSDIKNGKKTYVSLLGFDRSQDKAQQLLDSALNDLSNLPKDTSLLSKLAKFIVHRKI